MARPQLILPRADASCGKIFFADRRTADGHRIALEVWNRATGRAREGYRLAVYRCKRCGGFHLRHRPVDRLPSQSLPEENDSVDREERGTLDGWGCEAPSIRGAALSDPAWY
jgi:hypothetical protein